MRKPHPSLHATKLKKRRHLELGVLRYLKRTMQPVIWDELYVHYEKLRPCDVGPVLKKLKEGQYISVDKEKKVTITQMGLKRLQGNQFESINSDALEHNDDYGLPFDRSNRSLGRQTP